MTDNTKTYISILIDTLRKKESILKALQEATNHQAELLDGQELDIDAFNETVSTKDELLKNLSGLDEGFLEIYAKVGEQLKANPGAYEEQVKTAQELVRRQTVLSTELTASEERNKTKLALRLSSGKQKIKDFKVNSSVATAYYKNMSGKHQDGDSYFFNRKK